MKRFTYYLAVVLVVSLAGCTGPKIVTPTVSGKILAENASKNGEFAKAADAWKQYFNVNPLAETEGADFAAAATAAFNAGDILQSVNWFDQARYKNYADSEMYLTLAKIYRQQENISKELSALEFHAANFNRNSGEVNNRLFEIFFEIKMFDKAQEVWVKMNDNSKNEISNLKKYFTLNKSFKNATVCDSLAAVILEIEPENGEALEWFGSKYYWLGENRYQKEMEKYNNNKTNRQYKILLQELDLATADFKKALPYFEKLWKIEPGEKYASYFANIYARFGDESKVNFYKKYMK